VTKTTRQVYEAVSRHHPYARFHADARALVIAPGSVPIDGRGVVGVLSAGTADVPVAEEAAVTLEVMGNKVMRSYDVGVAGIHRLLAERAKPRGRPLPGGGGRDGGGPAECRGGTGASAGRRRPDSTGYGANFAGVTALCAMLSSCASGVSVVNIDNGFGAGYVASSSTPVARPVAAGGDDHGRRA